MTLWKFALGAVGVVSFGVGIAYLLKKKNEKNCFISSLHSEDCPRHKMEKKDLLDPPDCLCYLTTKDQIFENEILFVQSLRNSS